MAIVPDSLFSPHRFAAHLISGVMEYKAMLDRYKQPDGLHDAHSVQQGVYVSVMCINVLVCVIRRTLPLDYARGQQAGAELCMEQYYRLFTSYRRPGLKKDSLIIQSSTGAAKTPDPGHVIVACKNQVAIIIIIR